MYLLLAENNYISSREIKTLLAKNGLECEVVKCSSSDVLLDIAEKLIPGIIIIDFDLCLNRSEIIVQEIRMLSPKVYILAFVSADYFEKVAGVIKTGIDDYMIKPLRREDVIMRLILGLQRRAAQSEQPDFPAKKEQKEARDSWELASKKDPNGKEGEKSFVFYNCSENSSGKRKNNGDAELINFVDLLYRTKGEENIPPAEEQQNIENPGVKEDSHIFTIEDVEDEEEKGLFDDPMLNTGEERLRWPDEERVFSEKEEENMDSNRMADGYRPGEEPEQDEGSSIQDWMKEPELSSVVSEEEVEVAVNNHYLQTETAGEVDEPDFSRKDLLREDEDNIIARE
ncbi:MAG: response regulator [Bacillota bacterium]|nr:response regulator [Bacillota bacterium]